MKYSPGMYAKALAAAIAGKNSGADKISANFMSLLKKNGDEFAAKKILEEAARFLREKEGIRKIVIETAKPLSPSEEARFKPFMKENDVVVLRVNPEIIAGVRIFINDEEVMDGSMRKKLDTIFGQ